MGTVGDPIIRFNPQREVEFLQRLLVTSDFGKVGFLHKKKRIKIPISENYRPASTESSENGNQSK